MKLKKRNFLALALCAAVAFPTKAQTADSLDIDMMFKNLPEVMVKGERPVVRLERGRLTYNLPLLLEQIPADNAFDALSAIPGVSEQNGGVLFGGRGVTLLINGKPTTLTQEQIIQRLKAMPAAQLEKAEVMLSAPPSLHVRGAAINLVTKDNSGTRHTSGQVQTTYGQSKYGFGRAGGNLLHTRGKFSLDASYLFGYGKSYGDVEHTAQHPLGTERIPYYDKTAGESLTRSHDYRLGLEYAFAKNHRMSLDYTGKWTSTDARNTATGTSLSTTNTDIHVRLHNADFNYSLPFGLKLSASYTHYEMPKSQRLEGTMLATERDLSAESRQRIGKWMFAADQSHALGRGWGINYGAKAQLSHQKSHQTTRDKDGQTMPEATSRVDIDERIAGGYAGFSKQIGEAVSLDAALNVENYHTPRWNDWRLFPTLNASWAVNERHTLNLSFASDAKYSSYWSTMSQISYSSPYSEIWGNPLLKPAGNYDLSLMWQLNRKYTFVAFANFAPDHFVQLAYQPADRMAVIMKEVNFAYRRQFGFQVSAQFRAGKWLSGNAFAVVQHTRDKCDNFFDLPFDRSKVTAILGATASARLGQSNFRFILNPFFQSDAIQGVYDIERMFSLNATLRWTSTDGHWNLAAKGTNLTNRRFETRSVLGNQHFAMSVCQDWIRGELTLTYAFGNYKQKPVKKVDTSRMGH